MVVDDFEFAAKRFSKQQQQRGIGRTGINSGTTNTGRRVNTNTNTISNSTIGQQQQNQNIVSKKKTIALSEKARNEAIENKKQQNIILQNKQQQRYILQKQYDFFYNYYESNLLGIRNLSTSTLTSKLSKNNNNHNSNTIVQPVQLQLQPTSIYGDGDKITLPISILHLLTSNSEFNSNSTVPGGGSGGGGGEASPWYFRIAIPNPNYTSSTSSSSFPSSSLIKEYFTQKYNNSNKNKKNTNSYNDNMEIDYFNDYSNDDDNSDEDSDISNDEINDNNKTKLLRDMYLDELKYKYLSYTHGTVIEFTQDEGYIGLTKPICDALLLPNRNTTGQTIPPTIIIPVSRTIDPSIISHGDNNNNIDAISNVDITMTGDESEQQQQQPTTTIISRTPGHIAYNEFDIPNVPIEISFIQNISKGTGCTLIPDDTAIQNNFYKLKDIKYVLEQSLIKTRATITVNDTIITWYRGIQYNLFVSSIVPNSMYTSISCINTDIEIEFGTSNVSSTVDDSTTSKTTNYDDSKMTISKRTSSGGYTLGSGPSTSNSSSGGDTGSSINTTNSTTTLATDTYSKQLGTNITTNILLTEPPMEQKENIVTIQFRVGTSTSAIQIMGSNNITTNRRRFDITIATISDLFAYTMSMISLLLSSSLSSSDNSNNNNNNTYNNTINFQLVTRFPRRVYTLSDTTSATLLMDAGIQTGQELLLIEFLD